MHIIALDIKTGKVVWDVVTDDYRRYFLPERMDPLWHMAGSSF